MLGRGANLALLLLLTTILCGKEALLSKGAPCCRLLGTSLWQLQSVFLSLAAAPAGRTTCLFNKLGS